MSVYNKSRPKAVHPGNAELVQHLESTDVIHPH